MSLVTRHGVVQLARDARRITVGGRPISLAAPVRVRLGTWRVPSDLLPQALPTLVGARVRVTAAETREAQVPTAPGDKPDVPPAVASPPREVAVPAGPATHAPDPPAAPPTVAAVPTRPASAAPPELPAAPPRSASPSAARVDLRVRSYPTYTRVVLETDAPIEPRPVQTEGGLTVAFRT
jgi:hypothetical protein